VVRRGIAADHNLVPGNFKIDTDPKQITLLAARVAALDDNTAGYDSIKKVFVAARSRIRASTASEESM
jgi:hypothetical protein